MSLCVIVCLPGRESPATRSVAWGTASCWTSATTRSSGSRAQLFIGLGSLHTLDLDGNRLHSVTSETFRQIPALTDLYLDDNNITVNGKQDVRRSSGSQDVTTQSECVDCDTS